MMDNNKRDDVNELNNDEINEENESKKGSDTDEGGLVITNIEPDGKDSDGSTGNEASVTVTAAMPADNGGQSEKKSAQGAAVSKDKANSKRTEQTHAKQGKISTWFKEVKAEFNKVVWPNKKELAKMTLTVIVTSLIFGGLITGLDVVFNTGIGVVIDLLSASA